VFTYITPPGSLLSCFFEGYGWGSDRRRGPPGGDLRVEGLQI